MRIRERREDISLLAQQFVEKLAKETNNRNPAGLSSDANIWLATQLWPGNVRELHATIERGVKYER